MPASVEFAALPFDEAIEYFRGKVNLPTEHWDDLMGGMHSRAFVVAGGMKSDLLADMRGAVDNAIAGGATLADFRKDFDGIVAKHGWSYKGKRGWRTATIHGTNVRTAQSAGHYKQMTSPDVLKSRPYWRYVAGLSAHPRPEHLAWHDTILAATDEWWRTHFPPNGWGCKCQAVSVSRREMERDGLMASERPPLKMRTVTAKDGTEYDVPEGIDPGWDYNPGRTAWGEKPAAAAMSRKADDFIDLTPGGWEGLRPKHVPLDPLSRLPDSSIPETRGGMLSYLRSEFGDETAFSFQNGAYPGFRHDVLVNSKVLAEHIAPDRARYLPLLRSVVSDPYEIWFSFEQERATGRVSLRQRFIKGMDISGKDRGLLAVFDARDGFVSQITFVPDTSLSYLGNQRRGRLLWGRE